MPLPTPRLAYPGTRPWFNQRHPAAKGIRYAGVAQGNNFVNLLDGSKAAITGAVTGGIDGTVGPYATSAAANVYLKTTAINETPTAVTFAAMVRLNDNAATNHIILSNNGATFGGSNSTALNIVTLNPQILSATNVSSGITLTINNPYFIAVTSNGTTSYFVTVNLATGKVLTATSATSVTFGTPTASGYGLLATTTAYPLKGNLAAAMYGINSFLTLADLEAWATDPWSLWYPQTVNQTIFSSLGFASPSPPPQPVAVDVPPPTRLFTNDLRTWVRTAQAPDPIPVGSTVFDLPPIGRELSRDLRSWVGVQLPSGALVGYASALDLPPLSSRPLRDLLTWVSSSTNEIVVTPLVGVASTFDLPPQGQGRSVDLLTDIVTAPLTGIPIPPIPPVPVPVPLAAQGQNPGAYGYSWRHGFSGGARRRLARQIAIRLYDKETLYWIDNLDMDDLRPSERARLYDAIAQSREGRLLVENGMPMSEVHDMIKSIRDERNEDDDDEALGLLL